ncbi:sigma-54-dependent Fis family transcriptional regulator [candidate division KSB1 bacterium]|nr:sigma-54-dependent Fis family transcriptional regulator [candidate division KSB1 bacterium]
MKNESKAKILIVDDEKAARYGIKKALSKSRYVIEEAENGRIALEKIGKFNPDVILCDIYMPEMDGLELVRHLQNTDKEKALLPLVIVLTAFGSEKIAVEAMKAGAYDYLSKPFDIDELRLMVNKALEKIKLGRENILLRQQLGEQTRGEIIGNSPQINQVVKMIEKVARADVTLLLTGESGTGKELVARTVHTNSPRASGPFITMNCAAIPKDLVESELFGHEKGAFTGAVQQRQGKFEVANSGTLFLDEIADMSLETQAKILRILEEKSFTRLGGKELISTDVRLISATNKDLKSEIEQGRFREDLYYRIKVVEIHLPALRERKSDIMLLAVHFLQKYADKHDKNVKNIETAALQALYNHDWPGNVRQLMHVIEQSVVLTDKNVITVESLPHEITLGSNPQNFAELTGEMSFSAAKDKAVKEFENNIIDQALKSTGGNISKAARKLKMKRQFLQQKIKNLGLDINKYKTS